MFIFIDELDRCRPTYAIELLETVKHLFDIPGLVFVIATNTDQLQHSIKAVYGQEFDAQRYLYRFFNRSFTLREPDLLSFLKTQPSFEKLKTSLERSGIDGDIRTEHACLAESLAAISEGLQFDLRTCSQWLDQLDLYFASVENRDNYFWPVVAVMQAVKLKNPDFYRKLFIETKKLEEANVQIRQIADSGMSPIPGYKPQDKKLQLFAKGRRLLYGVKNNVLPEPELKQEKQIEVSFNLDFIGQIAGMLSDAMMDDNLTNHSYFPGKNEDKHRSLSDIRDTTAFFAIYKEQMVTKEVTKQDYLNLIDLASDLK